MLVKTNISEYSPKSEDISGGFICQLTRNDNIFIYYESFFKEFLMHARMQTWGAGLCCPAGI